MAVGGRYGHHRDKLYFIEAGHHLATGQPDQPVLVPILAAAWHGVVGGPLWAFRILPAVAAALTTVIASLTCRELGGSRRHRVAAAVVTALTSIVPGTGHLFSTTTFDLLGTATTIWLLIRALQNPRLSSWLLVGLAAGFTVPPLAGVPRLAMSDAAASVAARGSTSSAERATVIPLSFLMVGPLLSIPFVIGLVHLWRRPHLRWLTIAYAVFLAFVAVSGGKAYYPAGFFPAFLAAGVIPTLDWFDSRNLTRLAAGILAIASRPTAFFSLPLAPTGSAVFEVATTVNPDTAETVGWPAYSGHNGYAEGGRRPPR